MHDLDVERLADQDRRQALHLDPALRDHRLRADDPLRRSADRCSASSSRAGCYPRKLDDAYSPRFSAEDFGVVVSCQERDVAEIEALLRAHGATEVTLVES